MTSYFATTVGFGNKRGVERQDNDFYPTPPLATYSLVKNWDYIPEFIWEPAAGMGHISAELKRLGHDVLSTDKFKYENSLVEVLDGVDFLDSSDTRFTSFSNWSSAIITNPPYKNRMAERFLVRALRSKVPFVAMFCRMQFMNSQSRYKSIFSVNPPTAVLVFPKRINCSLEMAASSNARDHTGGMLEYCWYIWDKNMTSSDSTLVKWIDIEAMIDDWNSENGASLDGIA